MIVVIDGLEQTGKSTLASLCEFRGAKVVEWDPDRSIADYVKMSKHHDVVIDGGPLSTWAVAVSSGKAAPNLAFHVDSLLSSEGATLICMDDEPSLYSARVRRDKRFECELMRFAFEQSQMRKIRYSLADPVPRVMNWVFPPYAQQSLWGEQGGA